MLKNCNYIIHENRAQSNKLLQQKALKIGEQLFLSIYMALLLIFSGNCLYMAYVD
jgi:hypothetical protein